MPRPRPWFERRFAFGDDASLFPCVLERLRGTPARLRDRLAGLSRDVLTGRAPDGSWSIQENVGHLQDLEPLWLGRVEDVLEGREVLREADLTNARTHGADHDARPTEEVLEGFTGERGRFVAALEALDDAQVVASALHPRLRKPMRLLDLALFVAEHDDHHLARITAILRERGA